MFEHELVCRCSSSLLPRSSSFYLTEAKPHFAPDRLIDVDHIVLKLTVDLPAKTVRGTCTTEYHVVAPTVTKIVFDAIDLVIEEVFDGTGSELRFDQSSKKVSIYLRQPAHSGEHGKVVIKYHVIEPRGGLYFIAPDADYPDRPWQLWTQGQDQDNRYWIPCHDAPNEKAATEMIVTVDERFGAISNGKLLGCTENASEKTRTFHWKQSIPHASYLITLCVGEFTELNETWKNSRGDEIPVTYYTIPGRERETKHCFGKTPAMMDFFSKKIGVDYPYDKYAQVVAWDFIYGGMENTSASTQTEYTLHPESIEEDYSSEPLVAHELAHQWFGDLLTCKEWSHAWLNEGFATYFESLWMENEHGKDEFLYEIFANEEIYKAEDGGAYRRPIVTNVYLNPADIFDRHLYEKGARVLHMLHRMVGDEQWWRAIHRYVSLHFAKTVETIDLRRIFEETTGLSLSWFFEQWVYRGGHPDIKATYEWLDEKKQIKLSLSQKQKVDELTSLFRMPLKFKVVTSTGEAVYDFEFSDHEQTFWFNCAEKPAFVSLNPENTVLGNWDFNPGRELLIYQLLHDKDVMGRVFAANKLAKDHSRQSIDALGEALGKEKFWGVQSEIAESLGAIGSQLCFEYLAKALSSVRHARARKSVVKAMGQFRTEATAEIAERVLKTDGSPLVQFEAAVALGRSRVSGVFDRLSNALGKRESWHDYYDRGILHGLTELKTDDRVYPLLVKYTKPGVSMFTRREAVGCLARYGLARPNLVVDSLSDLTRDSNFFVRLAAIEALSMLGDDRAVSSLSRVADSVVEPRTHRAAIVAMKSLRQGRSAPEAVEKLKADYDRLREEYRSLLGRLEKIENSVK